MLAELSTIVFKRHKSRKLSNCGRLLQRRLLSARSQEKMLVLATSLYALTGEIHTKMPLVSSVLRKLID